MEDTTNLEERIWQWLDGTCTAMEAEKIQLLVQTHPSWKKSLDEIVALKNLVSEPTALLQPSLRFTKNVMEQISLLPTISKNYLNHRLINGIALLFGLLILGIIGYAISIINWNNDPSAAQLPSMKGLSIPIFTLNTLDEQAIVNVALCIVLCLFMLFIDRFLRFTMRHRYL